MKNIRPILHRGISLLGIQGVLGVGLLLFSLGLYQSTVAPGKERVAQMQAKAARLQQASGAAPISGGGQEGPLADFYSFFPQLGTLPDGLDKVYALAEREGLALPKGEYRLAEDTQYQIATYQAIFPLKGTYLQLRRFIVAVLNDLPFVSLEDLRLEKQRSADPVIDSQIRLTFYMRAK